MDTYTRATDRHIPVGLLVGLHAARMLRGSSGPQGDAIRKELSASSKIAFQPILKHYFAEMLTEYDLARNIAFSCDDTFALISLGPRRYRVEHFLACDDPPCLSKGALIV